MEYVNTCLVEASGTLETECVHTCLVEASGTLEWNVLLPVWLKPLALWNGMCSYLSGWSLWHSGIPLSQPWLQHRHCHSFQMCRSHASCLHRPGPVQRSSLIKIPPWLHKSPSEGLRSCFLKGFPRCICIGKEITNAWWQYKQQLYSNDPVLVHVRD